MKIALCYCSVHHGNTRKVLEAMAQEQPVQLIDIASSDAVSLEDFDVIGFASGIYGFEMHQNLVKFAQQYLPTGKKVFFVYTYGLTKGTGARALSELARQRGAILLGEYGCRGFDTFGPLKLIGGIAKGHPDDLDLQNARDFFQRILSC